MRNALIISMFFVTGNVLGQGIESELYQYNYSFIHPAFAGSEGQRISILARTATYDRSFANDRQTAFLVNYENYFEKIKSGMAVAGYSERLGPVSLSSVAISYNYKLALGSSSELIASARGQRHFYSINQDYFIPIQPDDPILDDFSESASNWAADLGVLLKIKEFHIGMLAKNILFTNNTIDRISAPALFDKSYAAIIGTSFTLNEHFTTTHSLYVPFNTDEYRIDLNNTLTINKLFLAGLSIERSDEKVFARVNAGLKLKDYVQILFLLYSGKRDHFASPKFRGEVFLGFSF